MVYHVGQNYRQTRREHLTQARILMEARARMLAEARERTNRHTEVQARMLVEARTWTFPLRALDCTEARDKKIILKVKACTEACPLTFPWERWPYV